MHGNPSCGTTCSARLAVISRAFLQVQVDAGASAVQLFDSWAGALSRADYDDVRRAAQPGGARAAGSDGPSRGSTSASAPASCWRSMRAVGADVVGVDWRVPLDEAARRLGPGAVVQGNLDPAVLLADWDVVEREVRRVVAEGRAADGHIFNLGHGVLPDTDPDVLTRVVELVRSL